MEPEIPLFFISLVLGWNNKPIVKHAGKSLQRPEQTVFIQSRWAMSQPCKRSRLKLMSINVCAPASGALMPELESFGIRQLSLGPGFIKASLTAMKRALL